MSDCDKAKIVGYREMSPEQIEMINFFKDQERRVTYDLQILLDKVEPRMAGFDLSKMSFDNRWLSIAKTHMEEGFMAAVRAVARPDGD